MIDIYGLDETAGTWRQKAAALAADVAALRGAELKDRGLWSATRGCYV